MPCGLRGGGKRRYSCPTMQRNHAYIYIYVRAAAAAALILLPRRHASCAYREDGRRSHMEHSTWHGTYRQVRALRGWDCWPKIGPDGNGMGSKAGSKRPTQPSPLGKLSPGGDRESLERQLQPQNPDCGTKCTSPMYT